MALQNQASNTSQAAAGLLTETGRLVSELENLLTAESRMMQSSTPEDLLALVQRKGDIISGIAAREAGLLKLFADVEQNEEINGLKNRLQACREMNVQNQQIASVELSHTRKSLEVLRSLLKLNDVPVYGSTGQVTVAREKRDFGSA